MAVDNAGRPVRAIKRSLDNARTNKWNCSLILAGGNVLNNVKVKGTSSVDSVNHTPDDDDVAVTVGIGENERDAFITVDSIVAVFIN